MSVTEYLNSLEDAAPPITLEAHLLALWYDAKGDWQKAHNLVDSIHTAEACHVHAYLHRKEGDVGNAAYWYRLANKPMPKITAENEWIEIVKELL
jgi:hypothetical protein